MSALYKNPEQTGGGAYLMKKEAAAEVEGEGEEDEEEVEALVMGTGNPA